MNRGLLSACLVLTGCALTSKADLVGTRYFTPENTQRHVDAAVASARAGAQDRPTIRLGRISSGANLRERIAYRTAANEINYYEDQRWSERPEIYVRRELARTLFEDHAFRRTLSSSSPTLDVEVVAFDELRARDRCSAHVELAFVLYADRGVLLEDTVIVDEPVTGSSGPRAPIEGVVAAMGRALDTATERIAGRVAGSVAVEAALSDQPR